MNQFIAALMAIVSAFSQGGKPDNLPPVNQEEAVTRGESVSQEARNLVNSQFSHSFRNEVNFQNDENNEEVTPFAFQESRKTGLPDTTRTPAFNLNSGKEMPAMVPMVAIERSRALDFLPEPSPTLDPEENQEPEEQTTEEENSNDEVQNEQEQSTLRFTREIKEGNGTGNWAVNGFANRGNK